ncbi:hypothetical protein HYY73_01635 [Candidatus Woesearchaeota archaeon]|nr:hypothetical protein [Candidatus Woesearchaeota archaeon]
MRKRAAPSKRNKQKGFLPGLRLVDDRKAVLIFLVFIVFVLFILDAMSDQMALFSGNSGAGAAAGKDQAWKITPDAADKLISKLTVNSREDDGVAFIVKDTVDSELLEYFANMDYEQVKRHLGINGDFAIHFEDQQGRIIQIGQKLCLGSKTATINGVPCG